jgi:beta-glucosidase
LFIGYRYYDKKNMPVQFPFGYGLSYTTFEYSNPQVSTNAFKDVDGITVTIDITNTGDVAGKEIVQVYVHDRESGLVRPEKELKGFAKVDLEAGETKTVSIYLDFRAFAYYHPEYKQWITEDGEFDLLIAASASDVRHTVRVMLESTLELPCILDKESTIREWMADPRGKAVFGTYYSRMETEARKRFGGDDGKESRYASEGDVGMDIMEMFNEMPAVSVMLFQRHMWSEHPEDIIVDLLERVHRQEVTEN